MTRYTLLLPLFFVACNSGSESTSSRVSESYATIIAYTPAPGQFINEPKSGFEGVTTPQAACHYAHQRLSLGRYISLGGWGGCLVAAFTTPVVASTEYDLWVKGNTLGMNSSEPGVVWVMQDTNGDGAANDTWYELRGSRHNDPSTLHNYRITYTRPADFESVTWSDNNGNHGTIYRMDDYQHTQANYYPAWIEAPTLTFEGTRLPGNVTDGTLEGRPGLLLTAFEWGYVDNESEIDALGQVNRFRIADAVTNTGEAAKLTQVDFIKIQSGTNAWYPGIGEISTEVCGIGCYRTHTTLE